MLKPNHQHPPVSSAFSHYPPHISPVPHLPTENFCDVSVQKYKREKATQQLICSSVEEESHGLPTTKPRAMIYSPSFIPASPFLPVAECPSTWCLSDCPSHSIPGLLLSARSLLLTPPDNHRVLSSYFNNPTNLHASGEQGCYGNGSYGEGGGRSRFGSRISFIGPPLPLQIYTLSHNSVSCAYITLKKMKFNFQRLKLSGAPVSLLSNQIVLSHYCSTFGAAPKTNFSCYRNKEKRNYEGNRVFKRLEILECP